MGSATEAAVAATGSSLPARQAATGPATRSKRQIGLAAIVGVAVVAIVVVGAIFVVLPGKGPLAPTSHTVKATVSLYAGNVSPGQTTCDRSVFGLAYMNIPGSKVTVTDQAGTVVGSTTVPTSGVLTPGLDPFGNPGQDCTFTFTVDVSDSATFYTFQVGTMAGPTYSHQDMVNNDWTVSLQ